VLGWLKGRVQSLNQSSIASVALILFFIFWADAILSNWVPVHLENKVGPLWMGLLMSFSSLVGLIADVVLPQLLKGITVKRLLWLALLAGFIFVGILFISDWLLVTVLLIVGMVFWGLYYELLSFADHQFVAKNAEKSERTSYWAVIGVIISLAYLLGPLVGNFLIRGGDNLVLGVSLFLSAIGGCLLLMTKLSNRSAEIGELDVIDEIRKWKSLFPRMWPVLISSLMISIIDSIFWTTGAVISDKLGQVSKLGGLFLAAFVFPSIFVGVIVYRWGIYERKKFWSQFFLLLGGLFLAGLLVSVKIWWVILCVFLAGAMTAAVWPLIGAVYSDIVVRIGKHGRHVVGLSVAMMNIGYIIGPAVAGMSSRYLGMMGTVGALGIVTVAVTLILIVATPKKIKLPQTEIQHWGRIDE